MSAVHGHHLVFFFFFFCFFFFFFFPAEDGIRDLVRSRGLGDVYKRQGLQEAKIDFDVKLVCFKSKIWIGNGQLIPAGPMREKISSLKRFDAVFLNGSSGNIEEIEKQIKSINLDIKIFKTFYKILNIQLYNLESKYLIFSGIGDPSSFRDILVENKFNIAREMVFPDHYDYSLNDLEKIRNIAKNEKLKIITTEKDFMKIPQEFKKEINYLTIDLIIQDERKLIELLTK